MLLHYNKLFCSEHGRGATENVTPCVKKELFRPCVSYQVTSSYELNFGAPAAVSSRAKYKRIAQSHVSILTDYLMIPWLQAEDWESPDWDLVLQLILGYTALDGSLAVNSVVKVFLT